MKNMTERIEDIKYAKDEFALLCSVEKIYVPFLNTSVEIWCDTFNDKIPPNKCINALKRFVENDLEMREKLINELNNYRNILIKENRIIKKSKEIKNINDVNFKNVILPFQNRTKNRFILLYGDTNWKIKKSKYIIEVEILFANNIIEKMQESIGLWTRLEWKYQYNTKELYYKGIENRNNKHL
jgi:hypothetical protein